MNVGRLDSKKTADQQDCERRMDKREADRKRRRRHKTEKGKREKRQKETSYVKFLNILNLLRSPLIRPFDDIRD